MKNCNNKQYLDSRQLPISFGSFAFTDLNKRRQITCKHCHIPLGYANLAASHIKPGTNVGVKSQQNVLTVPDNQSANEEVVKDAKNQSDCTAKDQITVFLRDAINIVIQSGYAKLNIVPTLHSKMQIEEKPISPKRSASNESQKTTNNTDNNEEPNVCIANVVYCANCETCLGLRYEPKDKRSEILQFVNTPKTEIVTPVNVKIQPIQILKPQINKTGSIHSTFKNVNKLIEQREKMTSLANVESNQVTASKLNNPNVKRASKDKTLDKLDKTFQPEIDGWVNLSLEQVDIEPLLGIIGGTWHKLSSFYRGCEFSCTEHTAIEDSAIYSQDSSTWMSAISRQDVRNAFNKTENSFLLIDDMPINYCGTEEFRLARSAHAIRTNLSNTGNTCCQNRRWANELYENNLTTGYLLDNLTFGDSLLLTKEMLTPIYNDR